jgi:predicted ATPase/signal transduction histidine kinase
VLSIPGYQITETIHTGTKTLVYRGYREQDQCPVIFKTLMQGDAAEQQNLARLQHEYALTKDWEENGQLRTHALLKQADTQVLILDDIGGISLNHLLATQTLPISTFLSLALAFARSLNRIHQRQLIHKDINPSNLVANLKTGQVQIIDFGISSQLSCETPSLQNPSHLEGTLAYLSPEQTGRMNQTLDYRTDFYSLGASFYKMLCGSQPFSATDPMELVHCHLAKMPPPPHKLRTEVPPILSELICKLMAKTAEARYQSAFGLITDLETCLRLFHEGGNGTIPTFALGQHDISERFQIPQKLYGRETELQQLLNAFEQVSQGSAQLLLVAGYSGVGKTALVHEIHKPVTAKRGYFITGKFDQLQRDIPYASLIQAFQELMRQLFTESSTRINRWRALLGEALGLNAQVIIDVIPEVEWIMGVQAAVPELPPARAQNRFNLVFQQFIRTFTKAEHPLVLFLDDLQWADLPSLQLLKMFMTSPETRHLLVIGAYRDNEIQAAHPLMLTLEEIHKATIQMDTPPPLTLSLPPLNQAHIQQLLTETLHYDRAQSESLAIPAALCLEKTQGNPFFLNQFLHTLVQAQQIFFNRTTGHWQWDIHDLHQTQIADDIVELMADKIRTLPPDTQTVIQLAACIGNQFDLNTLAFAGEQSTMASAQALWPALQEHLIIPLDKDYRYITVDLPPASNSSFRFIHDRVQQAAYSLIAESSKGVFHLRIGRLLLANLTPSARDERIFDLVYHWNRGWDLLTLDSEKEALARLNLTAGKKAKSSAAYGAAKSYFLAGLQLGGAAAWKTHYDLTLLLSVEATEAAHLSGDFEQMDQLAKMVLQNARTLLDQVKIYQIQIQDCIVKNQLFEAIEIALPLLKRLGIFLPSQPNTVHVLYALLATKWALVGKPVEDFVSLPSTNEAIPLAAMQILSSIMPAAYFASPQLLPLTIFKSVQLSIKYGNNDLSAGAYASYGVILCGVLGEIEAGYRLGELALTLQNRQENVPEKSLSPRVRFICEAFIQHWKFPFHERLKPLLDIYQNSLQTGDFEYAAYAAHSYSYILFYVGKNLAEVQHDLEKFAHAMAHLKQEQTLLLHKIVLQMVLNLHNISDDPCRLTGASHNEDTLRVTTDNRTAMFGLHFNKMILCYLFHKYTQAHEHAQAVEPTLDSIIGNPGVPISHFYIALSRLAIVLETPKSRRNSLLRKIASHQKKLKKWAFHAPMNYLNKWHLVEAELMRVTGRDLAAAKHYDQAIALAEKNGFQQEVALANELAARFYFIKGQEKIARMYLQDAYARYQQWGAVAKVRHMEAQYPHLRIKVPRTLTTTAALSAQSTITDDAGTRVLASEMLDMATVMKATQAISGEIVLSHLLEKLMRIAIENAGAQYGYLLLETDNEWYIEAEGGVDKATVNVLHSRPLIPTESADNLIPVVSVVPVSVIQCVARTRKAIVLDNASSRGQFIHDPVIAQCHIKSVLCTPILKQGKLAGVLYLENRLVEGAFTAARLDIMKILASQAAISIENARVYENLESTVAQRTAALSESNTALSIAFSAAENARQQAESAEQKATEALKDLRTAQANLIQSEKMAGLGTLTAGVAHEINNPTNFTHVAAQIQRTHLIEFEQLLLNLMEENPDPMIVDEFARRFAALHENVTLMLNGTERIKHIVKDLRSFTRLDETGKNSLPLSECINATLNLVRPSWLEKVEFITDYAVDPLYECWPALLNQVFMNLMVNACQAIEVRQKQTNSNAKGKLWLRLRRAPDELQVEIEDTGIGIEAEILPRILEPFFTTKDVGSGTGLGLSISYGIIQKHQGRLSITSTLGKGSCFVIHLPYAE